MSTKVVELKTVKVGKYIVLDGEASKVTLTCELPLGNHNGSRRRTVLRKTLQGIVRRGQERKAKDVISVKIVHPCANTLGGDRLTVDVTRMLADHSSSRFLFPTSTFESSGDAHGVISSREDESTSTAAETGTGRKTERNAVPLK